MYVRIQLPNDYDYLWKSLSELNVGACVCYSHGHPDMYCLWLWQLNAIGISLYKQEMCIVCFNA